MVKKITMFVILTYFFLFLKCRSGNRWWECGAHQTSAFHPETCYWSGANRAAYCSGGARHDLARGNRQVITFLILLYIYMSIIIIHFCVRWADLESDKEGFYLSHLARNNKHTAVLCCRIDTTGAKKQKSETAKSKKESIMFQVYRPNTGLQFRTESLAEIEKKYKKVQSDEAEKHWTQQFDASVNTCSHAYWRGNCRNVSMGYECEVSDW